MTLLAVDPGLNNGLAVLDHDIRLLLASEFPLLGDGANKRLALARLKELVHQFGIDAAVIEDVSAFPKQGVSSIYRFGRATGQVEGALMALGVPLHFVRPNVWKKSYGSNGASKNGMRAFAVQRWPQQQRFFERVKDEHRAEAALMGAWWLEKRR